MLRVVGSVMLFFTAFVVGVACGSEDRPSQPTVSSTQPAPTSPTQVREPLEALVPITTDENKATLGRRLFHDTQLSGDGTVACVSCHSLDHGGAEDKKTSIGIRGQVGSINAPTVLNSALNFVQFWDGRAATLEEQAMGPVTNPIEMGATWEQVIERLSADASYREAFSSIYQDGITKENIANAIAEYERTLLTPSRFDRYLKGEQSAMTDEERRGYEIFKEVGCTACHQGANIGGAMYQKMGLVRDYFSARGNTTTADFGRFNMTHDEADRFRFKVPSLRNIELTAPYLHDGTQQTLEDVVRVMGTYQLGRDLTQEQVTSIVAFLKALTGEIPASARLPVSTQVPSTSTTRQ